MRRRNRSRMRLPTMFCIRCRALLGDSAMSSRSHGIDPGCATHLEVQGDLCIFPPLRSSAFLQLCLCGCRHLFFFPILWLPSAQPHVRCADAGCSSPSCVSSLLGLTPGEMRLCTWKTWHVQGSTAGQEHGESTAQHRVPSA